MKIKFIENSPRGTIGSARETFNSPRDLKVESSSLSAGGVFLLNGCMTQEVWRFEWFSGAVTHSFLN